MRNLASLAVAVAACSSGNGPAQSNPDAAATVDGAPAIDTPPSADLDGDGLADDLEDQLARDYLPYISLDPNDGCPLSGFVARVRKHPLDPTKVVIVYSQLYQNDCGLGGHVGDDEAF